MVHCWHRTGHNIGEDQEEICCNCGIHYDPRLMVPPPGHGDYCPDKIKPEKSKGPCIIKPLRTTPRATESIF